MSKISMNEEQEKRNTSSFRYRRRKVRVKLIKDGVKSKSFDFNLTVGVMGFQSERIQ